MKRFFLLTTLFCILLASGQTLAAGVSVNTYTVDARQRKLMATVGQTLDTRTFSFANVAKLAGTTQDLQWGNAVVYSIDNVVYTKAAGSADLSTLGVFDAQAALKARLYVFTLDASGTVGVVSGLAVASTADPGWPDLPAGKCPFGAVKVVTAAATTFTLGTTAFDAVGITSIFYNLSQLPSKALDD